MSVERFENLKQIVKIVQPQFDDLAKIHNAVNYKKEAAFALQILSNNSYLADTAMADQDGFKNAIINTAIIGISLNPMKKHAYLIPRKKKIVLEISYLGLVQLALEVGAVKWVAAEIVRAKDKFTLRGLGKEPIHEFDPFSDRGEIVGAYCVAKTHDGEFIVTHMNNEEIFSIRDRSESFKAGKSSPWITDTTEMIKKTVIRRASKSWPMVDTRQRDRFEQAIDVTNEADPVDFAALPEPQKQEETILNIEKIKAALVTLNRTEEKFVEHLTRTTKREIKALTDLTEQETQKALVFLNQLIEAQAKKGASLENAG